MTNSGYKILIVDDEPDILEFLTYNLKKENFIVYTATNGQEGLDIAKKVIPHLIILDVMMPGMDGVETCEEIRKIEDLKDSVVVFLSARGEDYSQIAGFDAGADDYITKPVKPKILIFKIKALLKKFEISGVKKSDKITTGDIEIDKERYVVLKNNKEIILPKKAFELLFLLASKPNKVFSRDEIFDEIWGTDIVVGDRTIDVHIRKLREKLGEQYIFTVKGVGYKFTSDTSIKDN